MVKSIYTDKELEYIRNNYEYMTYREITENLNSFNSIKKDSKQVRTKACQMGLSKRIHHYNRRYFQNIDSQEKAYWLGFVFADGMIFKPKSMTGSEVSISLSPKDINHLNKFNKSINGDVPITTRISKESEWKGLKFKERESCQIRLYSKDMYEDLENPGVVQTKTYRKEFPTVEKQYVNSFILGFLDGDGHIYINKNKYLIVGFTNPNQGFLNYIKQYMEEDLGLKVSNIFQELEFKSKISLHGKNAESLLHYLYESTPPHLPLQRKKDIFLNYINSINQVISY